MRNSDYVKFIKKFNRLFSFFKTELMVKTVFLAGYYNNTNSDIQDLIKRAKGDGAFISIAHPEWYSLTFDEAIMLKDCHSVEIYNHASTVKCNRGSGIYIADFLLNENVKTLLTSTDDSHSLEEDAYGGWVFVKTKELNEKNTIRRIGRLDLGC